VPRPSPPSPDAHPFDALVQILADLRSPDGCPWDREQTLQTLKAYAVEETYEVLDAIDDGEPAGHRDELGDLLLQIVFQSQIRAEEGAFDAYDVCRAIVAKMVRRHPHVYEDADPSGGHAGTWEALKAAERASAGRGDASAIDGVPRSLPGLLRAARITGKASAVGFDWKEAHGVLPKLHEEVDELTEAVAGGDRSRQAEELGDLLFSIVNLARHLGVDAESAVRGSTDRFEARFRRVEAEARGAGLDLRAADEATQDALWARAKAEEHA